ncbi:MAG: cell division protein FtsZ [Patescibacteria group bacterium]|jgi:cell division protein FtsZ|nr:cell division protein FtsZ [Patescibacteria group bacterium]
MATKIELEVESFARIKVVGIGGSGKNAVNHMIEQKVRGIEFVSVNTDAQDLHHSLAKKKIHIGKNLTKGLGAGMDPSIGRRAAEETREEIQESMKGADMVFITCGLGGGTGTGAAAPVAQIARELGALTIGVVTKPFSFEGAQRSRIAQTAIDELKKEVDALIVIPNDRLFGVIQKDTSLRNAFAMCDEILRQAVEGIADLITMPGIINVDFADIRAVLQNAGSALMGIGTSTGEKRATEAAQMAINSPLLDVSVAGAKGVLFAVAGGEDLTMMEIQDAARVITENVDKEAKIIFGAIKDERLKKNELKVTVIASGFPENNAASPSLFQFRKDKEKTEEVAPSGKIFNTFTKPTPAVETTREEIVREEKPIIDLPKQDASSGSEMKPKADDLDDEWGAIPAFLRRKK